MHVSYFREADLTGLLYEAEVGGLLVLDGGQHLLPDRVDDTRRVLKSTNQSVGSQSIKQ